MTFSEHLLSDEADGSRKQNDLSKKNNWIFHLYVKPSNSSSI